MNHWPITNPDEMTRCATCEMPIEAPALVRDGRPFCGSGCADDAIVALPSVRYCLDVEGALATPFAETGRGRSREPVPVG